MSTYEAYTGGELNALNGMAGISAIHNSVPVMKLIKVHEPTSHRELCELISHHYSQSCDCGIISNGTVDMFGKQLYESQYKFWGTYKYSMSDCIRWEYDLFVVQSMRGFVMEIQAIKFLESNYPLFEYELASNMYDDEYRIDIIAKKDGILAGGFQIKPISYKNMSDNIHEANRSANKKSGIPVVYVYYNNQNEFEL